MAPGCGPARRWCMASDASHGRPPLDLALREALDERERAGLRRQLRPVQARDGTVVTLGGRKVVNVASNDYLGLSTHPALAEAAARAARDWGAGSGPRASSAARMHPTKTWRNPSPRGNKPPPPSPSPPASRPPAAPSRRWSGPATWSSWTGFPMRAASTPPRPAAPHGAPSTTTTRTISSASCNRRIPAIPPPEPRAVAGSSW